MNTISLSNHFQQYFQVRLANTADLVRRVQRIRYDVYCREFHYESEEKYPDGLEKDEYDGNSLHCLVVHKVINADVGCVRLVKTPADDPDYPLPMEKFCASSLTHPIFHSRKVPRTDIAEISRLAVHTNFRRRRGESESRYGQLLSELKVTEQECRTFPLISFALFAASTALSVMAQKKHIFIMAEFRLTKLLRISGFPFIQVGEMLDYHGMRAAYHISSEQGLQNMRGQIRELYDYVYNSLEADHNRVGLNLIQ